MASTLGQTLKQCRRTAGVTQRALARSVGVDVSYISKLENNRMPPPAADTIVKLARALKAPPDDLLVMSGKIPTTVSQMLGSKPAALRFFREAADLAITDCEWERLTRLLTQLRDGVTPTSGQVGPSLPGFLRDLLWDYNLEGLTWPSDQHLITGRILAVGNWRSVTWLREQCSARELRDWLTERRGRGLDTKRLRFWELVLDLPHVQVEEWIRVSEQNAWGRRTGA